jgi:hypothetical protein
LWSTGAILWDRIDLKDILKKRPFLQRALKITAIIAVLLVILIAINGLVFPLFGFQFLYDSGRFKVTKVVTYSEDESRVLNILIRDTAVLGEIPQREYVKSKTGLENDGLTTCLVSLDGKGDIALTDSGKIVDAYPWTSRDTGILVYLKEDDKTIGPLRCTGALHVMSVMPLLETDGKVKAVMLDSGDSLVIEIEKDEIVFTDNITAVVYRTENYKESRFFASSDGARSYYGDEFDINRVIRLDRALLIGNIIAEKIIEKIEK